MPTQAEYSLDLYLGLAKKRGRVVLVREEGLVRLILDPSVRHGKITTTWNLDVVSDNTYSFRRPYEMILVLIASGSTAPIDGWPCFAEEGLVDSAVRIGLDVKQWNRPFRHVRFQTVVPPNDTVLWAEGWAAEEDLSAFALGILRDIFPEDEEESADVK